MHRAGRTLGLAEHDVLQAQQQRAERDQQAEHQQHGEHRLRAKVDESSVNSLVNTPNGGRPGNRDHAERKADRQHRMGDREAADVGDALGALDLRDMADREEDRRLGQRMHGHVQQAGEIRERAADAEGEGGDAHVLDRRIGKQPFDVAPAVQHERREHQADEPERDHDGADVERRRVGGEHHLEAQQRVERDVEQQARQHRRDRRRSLRVGVGQPGVERRQPDLGAVADQQKHEGERQQPRVEAAARSCTSRSQAIAGRPSPSTSCAAR